MWVKNPPSEGDDQFRAVEHECIINPFDILEGGNGTTTYRPLNLYLVSVSQEHPNLYAILDNVICNTVIWE